MSLLTAIWASALAMAAGAILWMSTLIGLRVFEEGRARRRKADRRTLETALLDAIQGARDLQPTLAPFARRGRLMAETLLDFLALIRGGDREALLAALKGLDVPRTLRRRLALGSMAGRMVCLEALAAFPGAETEHALESVAERGPASMRLTALRSLYEIRGELPLGRLLRELDRGRLRPTARVGEFLRILVAQAPATAAAELRHGLLPEPVQLMLIDGLASAGDYSVLPTLMDQTTAPSPRVRAAAIQALGGLHHPAAGPAVAAALRDAEWPVRAAAAEAAGAIGLAALAPTLEDMLDDEVWRVRFLAAAALLRLGPDGLGRLKGAAAGANAKSAETAALALAEKGLAA